MSLSLFYVHIYSEETGQLWLTRKGKCLTKPPNWNAVQKSILCVFFFPSTIYRGDVPQGMNIKDALKEVLRNALIHDGLARGLREAVKALDKYDLYTTLMGGVHLMSHAHSGWQVCVHACCIQAPGSPVPSGKELLWSWLHQADWGALQWTSDQTFEGMEFV